jgi:hypothetical protein
MPELQKVLGLLERFLSILAALVTLREIWKSNRRPG